MSNTFEDARDGAIAQTVVALRMREIAMDISDRTFATRSIGAAILLEELMSVEYNEGSFECDAAGELIGRIVANAENQGIVISTVSHG